MTKTINLKEKFAKVQQHWSPKILGEVNESYVKAVKFQGEFMWHHHDHEDEMFLVVKGRMLMKFRDHEELVGPGEFIIVPHGVEHMPVGEQETEVILFEPKTTLNTGNVTNERTQPHLDRI